IASTEQYYGLQDISELDDALASIQSDIVQRSNSFYYMNYMTDKRQNTHELSLTVAENNNTDSSASISGSFNAEGFTSAIPGVYLNPCDTAVYGPDTVWCFANRPGYTFTLDANGELVYAIDTLTLHAVSYGGVNAPSYSWEMNNSTAFKIESLPLEKAVLIPISAARDTVTITLRDVANNFSQEIVFIVDPPEFYENMGIILGSIKDNRLNEISGIAASIKYPGFFWVHNDSGDDANVFLIDSLGNTIVKVFIENITSRDWEDIAVGPGPVEGTSYIYVADIGDNNAKNVYIYRIPEPDIDTSQKMQNLILKRDVVSAFTIKYADGPRDAEILLIEPQTKDLYIVTKRETNVQIYTLPYPQSETDTLSLVKSSVRLPFRMTNGGDISNDGNEILIKNLTTVYYWKRIPGETIIETLAHKAMSLPYIEEPQGEAITWLRDGSGYITVSEKNDNITPLLYLYKRH
ncbi:hypothetical protein ACFLRQ_03770, partial [Bacteroidota bacterium]